VAVIRHIAKVAACLPLGHKKLRAAADMIITAFPFLLRLGEYKDYVSDSTPFTLGNVQIFVGTSRLDIFSALGAELYLAGAVLITSTTQKNGTKNKVIEMGLSGDPLVCVAKAVTRRVCHLRLHNAPPMTPLLRVYTGVGRRTHSVTPALISETLHEAIRYLGSTIGFLSNDIPARSLRAAGAMAFLVGKVNLYIIQILDGGRLHHIFRYLHLSAEPITKDFAAKMLNADYAIAPLQLVPYH
jgi:hypothetical protein